MTRNKCKTKSCKKHSYIKGLCQNHYNIKWKKEKLLLVKAKLSKLKAKLNKIK